MSDGPRDTEPLFGDIPPELRLTRALQLPPPLAEAELAARLLDLAAPNTHLDEAISFLGGGAYDHYVPAIVDAIAGAVGHSPVTPASPQPILQAVFELQAATAALTGLELAAAPFPDGPAALAEAVGMAARATGRTEALVARSVHPRYRAIARTLLAPALTLCEVGYHGGLTRSSDLAAALSDRAACIVVQQPNYFGCLEDLPALAALARERGALVVALADPIALGVLSSPGTMGADLAVADAQPLGSRPAYGSGSLGLLAFRADLAPALVGWRVERCGHAFSAVGQPSQCVHADRLVRPLAYLAAVGGEGLARAATLSLRMARETQRAITSLEGFALRFRAPFFKEFAIECDADPQHVAGGLLESNILGALPLQPDYPEMEGCALFAATERRSRSDIEMLRHTLEFLGEVGESEDFSLDADDG